MTGKKILTIALIINIAFMGLYLCVNTILAADDEKDITASTTQASPSPQDQWEIIRLRQEELKVRENELKNLEKSIDEKIVKLRGIEASIQASVNEYKLLSDDRIRHLVKIYSSMKPNAAAGLMNQLDIDVAVEVFLNMKGDIAGGILSYMDTHRAAIITKKLANYRNKQGSTSGQP
ncbi:MAG TPA: hypothetical protein ENN05_01780 [Deltaproteobacteria bacterium]|nr:hypothetical protein [Deltaproteobacteria bacterium]